MKRFLQAMAALALVIIALGLTTNIFEPDPQKAAAEAKAKQASDIALEIERARLLKELNKAEAFRRLDSLNQEYVLRIYTGGHGQAFADQLALCISSRALASQMAELPCLRQAIASNLPWYAR